MHITPLTALVERIGRFQESLEITAHWAAAANDAATSSDPGFPDFDPEDTPELAAGLSLLERTGNRLRYRLTGDAVGRLFAVQHTGRHLDEVVPAESYRMIAPYFYRAFNPRPCLFKGTITLPEEASIEFERILLPVTRGGRRLLLSVASFSGSATLRADPPPDPGPGFHFHTVELATGVVDTSCVSVMPNMLRAAAA